MLKKSHCFYRESLTPVDLTGLKDRPYKCRRG
jgi:hypothetical protein